MAKQMLSNLLVESLGKYVEGLTPENLKVGVFNGIIEQNDLVLKPTALSELQLPINIEKGSLKSLKLTIPWTSLESKPVKVDIDGVYLQVGPLDLLKMSSSELKKVSISYKQNQLNASEDEYLTKGTTKEDEKTRAEKTSYMQSLAVKIVDNLELTLTNIHIRYEDSTSVPGKTLSAGITIPSIILRTTDDGWKEAYTTRKEGQNNCIRKLGQMRNLGIYWNTDCDELAGLSQDKWRAKMHRLIYRDGSTATSTTAANAASAAFAANSLTEYCKLEKMNYILLPSSHYTVKLIHFELSTSKQPKLDVILETSGVHSTIEKGQYSQVCTISQTFALLDRQKRMAHYRPRARPNEKPREWWKYAYRVVMGKDFSTASKIDQMLRCFRHRRPYIDLIKKRRWEKENVSNGVEVPKGAAFTPEDDTQLTDIEETLSINALTLFRQASVKEFLSEREIKRKEAEKAKVKSGWFGGGGKSSSNLEKDIEKDKEKEKEKVKDATPSFFSSMFGKKPAAANALSTTTSSGVIAATATAAGVNGGLKDSPKKDKDSSNKPNFEDDDFIIVEQFSQQVNEYNSSVGDEFPLRVNFNFGMQFDIFATGAQVLCVKMEMNAHVEMRQTGMTCFLTMGNLSAEDMFTENPVEKYILRPARISTGDSETQNISSSESSSSAPLSINYVSSSSGQSSLNMSLLPMEIISNEPCVNMLYRIFVGKGTLEAAAAVSNDFILSTMEKYTKETILAAVGACVVDIVIYAPKFVLIKDPQDPFSSCLVVDCGSLSVKGQTSPIGTVMSIDLQQVNMNLPPTLSERFDSHDSNNYIVTPFSVSLKYNDADKTECDSQVSVDIVQPMSFAVDFSKMRELLLIVKTLEKTMKDDIDPSDLDAPVILSDVIGYSNSSSNSDQDFKISSAAAAASHAALSQKVNPNKKLMLAKLYLNGISFKVLGDTFSFIFSIGNLNLSFLQRPYDSSAEFSLEYISLTDSYFDNIGYTKYLLSSGDSNSGDESASGQRLVGVTYVDVVQPELSNLWSNPQYNGYKKIAEVRFAVLNAHVDTLTLGRVGYLCKEIKGLMDFLEQRTLLESSPMQDSNSGSNSIGVRRRTNSEESFNNSQRKPRTQSVYGSGNTTFANAATIAGGGGGGSSSRAKVSQVIPKENGKEREKDKTIGLKLAMSLKSVSLELFHVFRDYDERLAESYATSNRSESYFLEKAFAFSISGLSIDVDAPRDMAAVGMSLDSITIDDTRSESANFFYRQLICKSAAGVEFSTKNSNATSGDSKAKSSTSSEDGHNKLVYLSYRQDENVCSIDLNYLTFFVNVESLVSLTTVGLDISNSITSAVSCFEDAEKDESASSLAIKPSLEPELDLPANPDSTALAARKANDQAVVAGAEPLKLSFKMNNPRIIFLEDPLRLNSRAVVAQCDFEVTYIKVVEKSNNASSSNSDLQSLSQESLVSEKVLGNLHNFEVFILSGMVEGRPEQIVDPTGCSVEFSKTSVTNTDVNMNLTIQFLPFHAKVSFSDIHMTNFILSSVDKKFQAAQANKKIADSSTASAKESSAEENSSHPSKPRASIAARRTSITGGSKKSASSKSKKAIIQKRSSVINASPAMEKAKSQETVYDFKFNLDTINITIINDFDVHATPLFRAVLSDTVIDLQGTMADLIGDASLMFAVDYFNSRPSVWEPIVEPWIPKAVIEYNSSRLNIDISNDQKFQVNVSGSMAKNLLHFFKLLGQHSNIVGEELRYAVAEDISTDLERTIETLKLTDERGRSTYQLIFVNELGISCRISDHVTKMDICDLEADAKLPVDENLLIDIEMARTGSVNKLGAEGFKRSRLSNVPLPKYFDLYLQSNEQVAATTIQQLPLIASKPKRYTLQKPTEGGGNSSVSVSVAAGGSGGGGGGFSLPLSKSSSPSKASQFVSEPVYDDVYENQRWSLLGDWGEPWTSLGDPGTWSTASKGKSQHYKKVALPNENWEWIGDWKVDMNGVVGKDIDNQGWEYATSFDSFNVSRKRRAKQSLDSVRRRRWMRARQLKSNLSAKSLSIMDASNSTVGKYSISSSTSSNRPFILFWDVKLMQNGTRFVYIRSSFEVVNILPFKVMLQLCITAGEFVDFGPLSEGDAIHLPLRYSHAISVRIRPVDLNGISYCWSDAIDCSIKFDDKRTTKHDVRANLTCEPDLSVSRGSTAAIQHAYLPVSFKSNLLIRDKELRLCLLPIAVLRNMIPSKYLFKVYSDKDAHQIHSGSINPGEAVKIYHLGHPAFPSQPYPIVSIQMGGFMWSAPLALSSSKSSAEKPSRPVKLYNLNLFSPSGSVDGISLTLRSEMKLNGVMEISIYSSHALQDRTGLKLAIMSRRFKDRKGLEKALEGHPDLSEVSEYLERKTYDDHANIDDSLCWADGAKGVVLFQSVDEEVTLGVNKGTVWAKKAMKLSSMGDVKTVMEIVDNASDRSYLLAYTLAPMPRAFAGTQMLKVMPWYTIVNCTGDDLFIYQSDYSGKRDQEPLLIRPDFSKGWHKNSSKGGTGIRIRTAESKLSLGCVDLNCIGSTLMLLPQSNNSNAAESAIVLHIEVKLAESADDSYITVVIWREMYTATEGPEQTSIAIKNNSDYPVCIRQDLKSVVSGEAARAFEICLSPHTWTPFAWADPGLPARALLSFSTSNIDDSYCINLDMRGTGKWKKTYTKKDTGLPDGKIIKIEVSLVGGGQVVQISEANGPDLGDNGDALLSTTTGVSELCCSVFLRSFGLSLIAERPVRRELLSVCVDGIDIKAWQLSNINSDVEERNCFELKIMDVQIDNYSESVVYPVLLHSFDSPERKKFKDDIMRENRYRSKFKRVKDKKKKGDKPNETASRMAEYPNFLHMTTCRQQMKGSNVPMVKELAFRMLEFKLEVDSASLILFALDLFDDLSGSSSANPLYIGEYEDESEGVESLFFSIFGHESKNIIHKRNEWCVVYQKHILSEFDSPLVNLNQALKVAQAYKTHFESIVIHPLKMKISFCLTDLPRRADLEKYNFSILPYIRGLVSLKEFVIKVKSFQSENVLESTDSLISRILSKTLSELKSQHAQIAGQYIGSLDIIGKPADFSKKIGDGVKDLWYEPVQGGMHSPEAFFEGLGRGTASFVGNIVGGTLSSTAAIVGSATTTLTKVTGALTGDKAYVKKLEEKRRENMVAGGGMLSGLENGATSIAGGIASGITGLVTKPIEEGRKGGVLGVAKGLGLGIVGLVTKPVMGITEGLSNIAIGAQNEMSDVLVVHNQRPPRAFVRSVLDDNERVLSCYNKEATEAQATVLKIAKTEGLKDESFYAFIDLGFKDISRGEPAAVVITKLFVYFLKLNRDVQSRIAFSDISHFEYLPDVLSVRLIVYQRNIVRPDMTIPCFSLEHALELYGMLYRSSPRMGNPSLAMPVEVVSGYLTLGGGGDAETRDIAVKLNASLMKYRFGQINHIKFRIRSAMMTEERILERAEESLMNVALNLYSATIQKVTTESPSIIDVESTLFNGEDSKDSEAEDERKFYKIVEVTCLQLLYEWRTSHVSTMSSSRCCFLLLINRSQNPVQILRTEIKEGKKSVYFACKTLDGRLGYSEDSRVVDAAGGMVVFFCWGFIITPFNLGHVKTKITTGAGDITISSRPTGGSVCKASGEFSVGFVEKYVSEHWCKFVALIS